MSFLLALGLTAPAALAQEAEVGDTILVEAGRPQRPNLELSLDEYELKIRDYTFPSGVRIIFQEDHTQPIVSITSVIDRGSSHDPEGLEGIAHLVEHLWFRSIHGENAPKVWDILKEVGANLNASTANDWTNYMTVGPREALIPLLELEGLRLSEPVEAVTEEEVNLEREIVRNELRMRYENDGGSALYYLWDKLYPKGHPYSRLGIGTHDSLNNITLKDVQDFCQKNYRPENATIVVVGDFSLDETGDFLAEAFPIELLEDPDNPVTEENPLELIEPPTRVQPIAEAQWKTQDPIPPVDRTISYHKGGVETTTAVMAWSMPGGYRWDQPLMEMTANFMSFAINSYLNENFDPLTDELDENSSAGCFLWASELNSTAMCWIEVPDGKDPEDMIETAADGLYQMWDINNRYWQEYLFSLSRYQWMASVFRSVEVVSAIGGGRAAETANFTHFTGDPMYYSRQFEWLNRVEAYDAAALAEKWLTRDRFVSVVLEPYEDEDITMDSTDAVYKGTSRSAEVATMMDLDTLDAEMLERVMVPPDMESVRNFTLGNGLEVVLMNHGQAPFVQAGLYFPGGDAQEPMPGLNNWSLRNTEDWPAGNWQEPQNSFGNMPLRLAGSWTGGDTGENRWMGVQGSSGNLDGLLWLVRERVELIRPDVSNVKNRTKVSKKGLRADRKDPDWWTGYLRNTRLFPGHPAVHYLDEHDYDAMAEYKESDIQDWYDQLYQPSNAVLYVVGRISDMAEAERLVQTYLGSWQPDASGAETFKGYKLPEAPEPPDRQVIVLDKERVSQTSMSLACQVGPATLENLEAREVLTDVLDEMAWSRLRETAGVTYGAGAGQWEYPGGAAGLYFGSLVQNDAVGLAVDTFFDAVEEAQAGELDPDLVQLMKLNRARKYVLGHQTTYQMLNRLSGPIESGYLSWDYISEKPDRLASVDIDDLPGLMERCVGHEVVIARGPKDVILPQLEGKGYEVEVFDYEAEADRIWREYDPKGYAKAKKKEAKSDAKAAKKAAKKGDDEEGDGEADAAE